MLDLKKTSRIINITTESNFFIAKKYLIAVHEIRNVLTLNKPLDLNKTFIYKSYYDYQS